MNFEEFLEAEKKLVESYQSAPSFHGKLSEYISFKRNLGKWAWKCYVFDYVNDNEPCCKLNVPAYSYYCDYHGVLREIARNCLGKAEIEKRLKELKK